ncbi:hypothetical protein ACFPK9_11845 [Rubritalea spongiae]|uniref:Uncharacterized protein n=1 Tax=Rubritalea spongiae TaxID=430797 RepID=A0ABW5DYG1_9BACT
MKTPLYAVAVAGIAAYGIYAWTGISTQQELVDKTNSLDKDNIRLENQIDRLLGNYKDEQSKKASAEGAVAATQAQLDARSAEQRNVAKELATLESSIAAKQKEIAEMEKVIAGAKDKLGDVDVSSLPAYIQELNDSRKTLNREYEELLIAAEEAQAKRDTAQNKIQEIVDKEAVRGASLAQNSISSLVTAVNSDWGFVVISPHPQAKIESDSRLMVVRGARPLARLNISAVEANRVIADIDYDSLADGARIRAGDRVILAKPNVR